MLYFKEIIESTNGNYINGDKDKQIVDFCIDSREIKKDDFFIPFAGQKNDANSYIIDCVNKGCSGFFVNSSYEKKDQVIKEAIKINKEVCIVEVKNTYDDLILLGKYNRKKYNNIKIIGITGSVGKTSTKEMISYVLEEKYKVLKTIKNYNSQIGLPFMLLMLDNTYDVAVLEVGISDIGEMDILADILMPDIAVITNILNSHIEFFKTRDNIYKEKLKISKYMNNNNILIVNEDDDMLNKLNSDKFIIKKFSKKNINSLKITNEYSEYITNIYGKDEKIIINSLSYANILNSLCAIEIAKIFNLPITNIKDGIKKYKNYSRRFETIKLKSGCILIDDSYNACFESVKMGLYTLNEMKNCKKQKIAVLGDILELGDYSIETHLEIGNLFKNIKVDKLYLYGKDSTHIKDRASLYMDKDNIYYFTNQEELEKALIYEIDKENIIYFKASNGMNFKHIIDTLKKI